VPPDVAGDLTASGGVADHCDAIHVECGEEFGKVVRVGVHVVAVPWLTGTSVAPAVVRNAAEAVRGKVEHLGLPGIGAERPAVAEAHDRARTPVLVVDVCAVFDCDVVHVISWFFDGWNGLRDCEFIASMERGR
jgi:hypothetical protein